MVIFLHYYPELFCFYSSAYNLLCGGREKMVVWGSIFLSRHEFHPGLHWTRGVSKLLPLQVENAKQPVARGTPGTEPACDVHLGLHLVPPVQQKNILEDLMPTC